MWVLIYYNNWFHNDVTIITERQTILTETKDKQQVVSANVCKGAFVKLNVRQKRKLMIIFARPPPPPPEKETGQTLNHMVS